MKPKAVYPKIKAQCALAPRSVRLNCVAAGAPAQPKLAGTFVCAARRPFRSDLAPPIVTRACGHSTPTAWLPESSSCLAPVRRRITLHHQYVMVPERLIIVINVENHGHLIRKKDHADALELRNQELAIHREQTKRGAPVPLVSIVKQAIVAPIIWIRWPLCQGGCNVVESERGREFGAVRYPHCVRDWNYAGVSWQRSYSASAWRADSRGQCNAQRHRNSQARSWRSAVREATCL